MTILSCIIFLLLGNGGWLFTVLVNSADLKDYFDINITEYGIKKVFLNINEEFTFNLSIASNNEEVGVVKETYLTFHMLNITGFFSKNRYQQWSKNQLTIFHDSSPPTVGVTTINAVLQSLLPPLTKVQIDIQVKFKSFNGETVLNKTELSLYVNPPKVTTNITTNTVELIDKAEAIKVNIVGIQGDFPLTLEIICGLNETQFMMLQLIDEDNQSSLSEFTQATITIPYSEETKTDESFILLVNRVVMNNTENVTDVIAIGLLFGDNGAVVEHIQVTLPKVEATEKLGNTSESNYNWLTIEPSIFIDDFLITNKVSQLNVTIKISPDSYLSSDKFQITSSSNHSSVKLSPTNHDFIPKKEGKNLLITILLQDETTYPLQEFPITLNLYKNGFQLYQSVRYCFYGGLPNITVVTSSANEFMPGMTVVMDIAIDETNMITSNLSVYVQVKLPSSNQMPYLKYKSHRINSKRGSKYQNPAILESTFNDGSKDMIYIEILGGSYEKAITIEISGTVLENPSLNNTPNKYPISVAVIIGPYMAYFDEIEIYLKKNATEMSQNATDKSQNVTDMSPNDTENKETKIKMEIEAIITSFSTDDVSIKIVIAHDSQNSAPISNPAILLYRVPFISYKDFNINSSLSYQSHEKYAQLWKFQGDLLPTQRIVINQNGTILQKFLLKEGVNELYILVTISFANQSGEIVRMDKLAPLFLYKKPMVIVPPHSKRLQEYYGLGLFFDERGNGLNIFACMNQHKTSSEAACFYSSNYGATWKEMDLQVGCIIGYNHDRTSLVGISRNQQYYIHYRDESRCYAPYEGDITHFGTPVVLEDAEYVKMENVKEHHKRTFNGNHEFAGTIHGLYYRDTNDKNGDWMLRMKW